MSLVLHFIRHLPPASELNGVLYGDGEIKLDESSEAVLARLKELSEVLPRNAGWISSPVPRAQKTAEMIRDLQGQQSTLDIRAEFAEQSFGAFVGHRHVDLATDADFCAYKKDPVNFQPPKGESFQACFRRVGAGMDNLCRNHIDDVFNIATHGGVLRSALGVALGMEPARALKAFQITPLAHVAVAYEKGAWQLLSITQGVQTAPLTHPASL